MALRSEWSAWTSSVSGSWLSMAVVLTTLAMAPTVAPAQRANGSLGVSATVLPPIMTRPAELTSFQVERDGTARLETTAPGAGAVSLIVMATVSSSANGFVPVAQPPVRVKAMSRTQRLDRAASSAEASDAHWRYEVELGSPPVGSESQDVSVRISYLIVPGT